MPVSARFAHRRIVRRAGADEDVAYRAGELARGGAAAMLAGMRPELSIRGDVLNITKKRAALD